MTQATQTIPAGYKRTEIGVIPEDWDVKNIGDIADVIGGGTPSTSVRSFWNGNIDWFTPTEIGVTKFVYESKRKITEEGFRNSSAKLLNEGTILLTSRAGIGDIAILKKKSCTNQGFQSLSPKNNTDSEFLYYLMLTKKNQLLEKASGSTFLEISPNNVRSVLIQIPKNPTEQTAIATSLSDTDTLIENLEKLIAKKMAIKQGAMQQLLTGKKRLPGFSGEWDKKSMHEIGKTYGGLSGKVKSDFGSGNSRYIPFVNIMSNPIIDITYFDKVNIKANEIQAKAQKNDLFFNGSSETPEEVGMCSFLAEEIPNLYLNSFCFGFRLNKELKTDGLWLAYYFRSSVGRELIFSLAQGATRYNLSKTNFLKLRIPYPETNEQTAIATVLSDMDTEIENLENKLEKYRQIKTGMMQQLLTGKIRLLAK